jgi:hypothetical protein
MGALPFAGGVARSATLPLPLLFPPLRLPFAAIGGKRYSGATLLVDEIKIKSQGDR